MKVQRRRAVAAQNLPCWVLSGTAAKTCDYRLLLSWDNRCMRGGVSVQNNALEMDRKRL